MANCPKCGVENADEAQFCKECGALMTDEPIAEVQPTMAPTGGEELTVVNIITQGLQLGLKNAASIVAAVVLWALTIWIPYINVGTTIALWGGIVIAMSTGEIFNPLDIFKADYRKYMGEFFLLMGLIWIGVLIGSVYMIVPGIIISLAWSLALPIMIDKELSPIESLRTSNAVTYGKKWVMFGGLILLWLAVWITVLVLGFLFGTLSDTLGTLIGALGYMVLMPAIILGAMAHIYGVLSKKA
mgnify:CR=1 FL=1